MRDVPHHSGKRRAERTVLDTLMKRGMAHAGSDAQPVIFHKKPVKPRNGIDVDQMRRTR